MRRELAAETKSLIESLHKEISFWKSSTNHKVTTLALISQTHDAAAIPDVVSLLLNRNRRIAHAAANTVSALVETVTPTGLPWLDQLMRERSRYRWSYPSGWADLKAKGVGRLQLFGEQSAYALGMASFHFNGFVREEALRKLGEAEDGTELPFLLLRLNDWVTAVRDTADRLVRERLNHRYAPFFVLSIQLVNRLRSVRRGKQHEIVEAIEHLLTSEGGFAALEAGFSATDRQVRRICYEVALRSAGTHQGPVVERALSEKDPAVQLQAARNISLVRDSELLTQLLLRAKVDRFAPVRKAALQIVAERFPEKAGPWLEDALMDPHPSLRGCAQFQMGRAPAFPVPEVYRSALRKPEPSRLYAAISGLGETGRSADADLVIAYASHQTPRIRRAALRALARLDAAKFVDLFSQRLSDHSPSVSREAMKGLSKVLHLTTGADLWRVFAATSEMYIRRNSLFLIARLGKWESIGYLVEAVGSGDCEMEELAKSYIRRWQAQFNSSFTAPTKTQADRLRAALQKTGLLLNPSIVGTIEYGLRSF